MPIKVSLLKLTQPQVVKKLYEETQVIQDMLVPTSKMANCIREFRKLVNVFPLWLCPFRLPNDPGKVCQMIQTKLEVPTHTYERQ